MLERHLIVTFSLLLISFVLLGDLSIHPSKNKQDFNEKHHAWIPCEECSKLSSNPGFTISQFEGTWNYIKLYSAERFTLNPKCMKMDVELNYSKLSMDVSMELIIPSGGSFHMSVTFYGLLDYENSLEQELPRMFSLTSDNFLVPSKWVFLSGNNHNFLYLICGEYPDETFRVGEIGILSRERNGRLSEEETAGFQKILSNFSIIPNLEYIDQHQCD